MRVGMAFVTALQPPDLLGQARCGPSPTCGRRSCSRTSSPISATTKPPVRYPEYQLLAVDGDQVRARIMAVPYAWSGADEDLPENGWDFALGMAFRPEMPEAATAVWFSATQARIHPDLAGAWVRARPAVGGPGECGGARVSAPPCADPAHPQTSRTAHADRRVHPAYATRRDAVRPLASQPRATRRPAGSNLPFGDDHRRKPAKWRAWTGLPFDTPGLVEVEGALSPVHVSN